jgi:hypothetical protein
MYCCIALLHLCEGRGELVGLDLIQAKNLRKYEKEKWLVRTAIKLVTNCTKSPVPSRSERTIKRVRTSFITRYAAPLRSDRTCRCLCYQRFSFCHNNILQARGERERKKRKKIRKMKYI